MVSLGRRLDDSVKEKLDDWCENKKLDKVKETEGEKSGTVEGEKESGREQRATENQEEMVDSEKQLEVLLKWLCISDMAACWKVYLFGGVKKPKNCPFCDVFGAQERGKVWDESWGTWKEGYSKEFLTNLMGIGMEDFCICSLHMLLRVVNYLISRLYSFGLDGNGDWFAKKLEKLLRELGVGWNLYEDKTGALRLKAYGGQECKKILENAEKFDKLIEENKMVLSRAVKKLEEEQEKKTKKKSEKKKQQDKEKKEGEIKNGGKILTQARAERERRKQVQKEKKEKEKEDLDKKREQEKQSHSQRSIRREAAQKKKEAEEEKQRKEKEKEREKEEKQKEREENEDEQPVTPPLMINLEEDFSMLYVEDEQKSDWTGTENEDEDESDDDRREMEEVILEKEITREEKRVRGEQQERVEEVEMARPTRNHSEKNLEKKKKKKKKKKEIEDKQEKIRWEREREKQKKEEGMSDKEKEKELGEFKKKGTFCMFAYLFDCFEHGEVKGLWEEKAKCWGFQLRKSHGPGSLRIYPHILICHGKVLVEKFGPMRDLNQQGFENANSANNTDQQCHTTAKKNPLKQVFLCSWGYHLHDPPTTTKQRDGKTIANSKHTQSQTYNLKN